ncbi:unnamed protein product [Absidia cylindrospora]
MPQTSSTHNLKKHANQYFDDTPPEQWSLIGNLLEQTITIDLYKPKEGPTFNIGNHNNIDFVHSFNSIGTESLPQQQQPFNAVDNSGRPISPIHMLPLPLRTLNLGTPFPAMITMLRGNMDTCLKTLNHYLKIIPLGGLGIECDG